MAEKINTLKKLRQEKELTKIKMKLSRQAFFYSLGENRRYTQRMIVNKVAVPVGAGALASWLVQILIKKTTDKEAAMEMRLDEEQKQSYWWIPIVRTVMRYLESYLNQIDPPDPETLSENGHTTQTVRQSGKS